MIDWLFWIGAFAAALVLGSVLALWSYGRFARRAQGPSSQSIAPGEDAALDRVLAPLEAAHPGRSGAVFVFDPLEAFAIRRSTAGLAQRSLDMLYYIWEDDMTGRLLAQALLDAADRGVRVRMLLDDVNVLGRDPIYLALDRHPHIDVRLFNPIRNRSAPVRRGVELLLNLVRYNRRMHGKLWIVDGRVALTGGRNVGDVYFGAATGRKRNVDDIDIVLAGPVVRDAAEAFDGFWNSTLALPISSLWHKRKTSLERLKRRLEQYLRNAEVVSYLEKAGNQAGDGASAAAAGTALPLEGLRWSDRTSLITDPPEKALGTQRGDWLPEAVMPAIQAAEARLRIMTPYLVPGGEGLGTLVAMAARGVKVEIVTNALAVADHVIVHGAYRWYRKSLVAAGVKLHEFSARRGSAPWPEHPRKMLHGKALIVDDRLGLVGSFNFDLRSAFLNTEIGILFEDPALLAELGARFDRAILPDHAFQLSLDGKLVAWSRGGVDPVHLEPDSTLPRRLLSFAVGHLPIHRWL